MNRGSASGSRTVADRVTGFNEAPIHESGKSRSARLARTTFPSFNEAPIHESGKCGAALSLLAMQRASMRPRFMNRGSSG